MRPTSANSLPSFCFSPRHRGPGRHATAQLCRVPFRLPPKLTFACEMARHHLRVMMLNPARSLNGEMTNGQGSYGVLPLSLSNAFNIGTIFAGKESRNLGTVASSSSASRSASSRLSFFSILSSLCCWSAGPYVDTSCRGRVACVCDRLCKVAEMGHPDG